MSDLDDSLEVISVDSNEIEFMDLPPVPRNHTDIIFNHPYFTDLTTRYDDLIAELTNFDSHSNERFHLLESVESSSYTDCEINEETDSIPTTEIVIENAEEQPSPSVRTEPKKTYYMYDEDEEVFSSESDSPVVKKVEKNSLPVIPKVNEQFMLDEVFKFQDEEVNLERSQEITEFMDSFLYSITIGGVEIEKHFPLKTQSPVKH